MQRSAAQNSAEQRRGAQRSAAAQRSNTTIKENTWEKEQEIKKKKQKDVQTSLAMGPLSQTSLKIVVLFNCCCC